MKFRLRLRNGLIFIDDNVIKSDLNLCYFNRFVISDIKTFMSLNVEVEKKHATKHLVDLMYFFYTSLLILREVLLNY